MWMNIKVTVVAATFLAGATAAAYAQDSTTPYSGKTAPGKSQSDQTGSGTGGTASRGNGPLGAGDAAKSNWTGTNPWASRGPAGAYSGNGPGNTGGRVVPGGNGALGAGDTAIGSWTGTNPGVDRRPPGSSYYGPGYR